MAQTIKLLDVVALTVDLPNTTSGAVKWALWWRSWLVGQHLKLNSVIVKVVPTNRWGYVQISSWCCTTSLSQHSRRLRRVHWRVLLPFSSQWRGGEVGGRLHSLVGQTHPTRRCT